MVHNKKSTKKSGASPGHSGLRRKCVAEPSPVVPSMPEPSLPIEAPLSAAPEPSVPQGPASPSPCDKEVVLHLGDDDATIVPASGGGLDASLGPYGVSLGLFGLHLLKLLQFLNHIIGSWSSHLGDLMSI